MTAKIPSFVGSTIRLLRPSRDNLITFGRGTLGAFVINVLGAGLGFALQILLARVLGVESYGVYVFVFTWVGIVGIVGEAGMAATTVRFMSSYIAMHEWQLLRGFRRFSIAVTSLTSLVLAAILFATIDFFRDRLGTELVAAFLLAALVIPVGALTNIAESGLRALRHVVLALWPQAILHRLLLMSGIGLLSVGFGRSLDATGAVVVHLAARLFTLVLMFFTLNRKLPRPAVTMRPTFAAREWMLTGFSFIALSGVSVIMSRTDIVMIGYFLGTSDAGIFSVAARVAHLVAFGFTSVNAILAPMIARLYAQSRMEELQKLVVLGAWGATLFSLFAAAFLVLFGDRVLGLFGAEFALAYLPLAILVLGQLVNACAGSVNSLMTMTGHQREAAIVFGASALLNIVLNAILIPKMGLIGAALSSAMVLAIWNIVLVVRVVKHLGINPTIFGIRRIRQTKS